MTSLPVLLPALAGVTALLAGKRNSKFILRAAACAQLTLAVMLCVFPPEPGYWLALDGAGQLFLLITSVLFTAAAFYAGGYLAYESDRKGGHILAPLFGTQPQPVFAAFMLFFLSAMSFVCVSRHLGLMWVALEATTLTSVPLICFHHMPRQLEAAWKYMMLCSVGIALALLGNFFIAAAIGAANLPLLHDTLRANAGALNPVWLKAAFAVSFIGYGTKMGLAPMHTWLPDTYSEAPSVVALLSGALLNCAFLCLMRVSSICSAAGLAQFSGKVFIAFGLLSVAVAAAFIIRQKNYKRLLGYSSIENMGIIVMATGAGAHYAAVLHTINHSLIKAMLFLLSGNILRQYKTKLIGEVHSLYITLPRTALLWAAGFAAILGLPPFGLFLSKLLVIKGLFGAKHYWAAGLLLFFIAVIFMSVTRFIMDMLRPQENAEPAPEEWPSFIWPAALLGLGVLVLGIYIPAPLDGLIRSAACALGGGPCR